MDLDAIIKTLEYGELDFTYDSTPCGVSVLAKDSIKKYEVWCGDKYKIVKDLDKVVYGTHFKGKSLKDIINLKNIEMNIY